jgi:hypothetical protein
VRPDEREIGQNLESFWSECNSNSVLRVYFSRSRYEVFVSTENVASGIFFPDMQKKIWREREKEEYRISVKILRTN